MGLPRPAVLISALPLPLARMQDLLNRLPAHADAGLSLAVFNNTALSGTPVSRRVVPGQRQPPLLIETVLRRLSLGALYSTKRFNHEGELKPEACLSNCAG